MNDGAILLLDLLANDAGSDKLAQVSANEPGLARAAEMALRVHARLSLHRRRETGLNALFDTASDLARRQRDPDAVLRSIVRRARMLLAVDVSYLTLNDEAAGCTVMRVTDGSVSQRFQQVVLNMGEGLGGLVAQTAHAHATSDYFRDARFRHTDAIDRAVNEEGLIAILAVPLAIGEKVIGVLFASDRAAREFTPDDIALLSALADHAAIALDNSSLLSEISAHNIALRRAEETHDRLMDLVLRGGDVTEIATALADVLDGDVCLFDVDGSPIAQPGGRVPAPSADQVAASRTAGRSVPASGSWVVAVQAGPEPLGSIVLASRADLTDADRRLFERAAVVTALLLMVRRSIATAEDEVRGELLTDLLTSPGRNTAVLLTRAERSGLDLTKPHVVLVAHAPGVPRWRLTKAAAQFAVLAGVHSEEVVLVASEDGEPGRMAEVIAKGLRSAVDSPVTVGAAGPASGPAGIAAARSEAGRSLSALLALGRAGRGASMAELGFVGSLLADSPDLPGFVRRTIGPVVDYDARRGTELVRSLRAYFGAGGNVTRARNELGIHINTVVQRMDRVAKLLGADWQSPDRALEIQLALRLHDLRS